jgi:isoleucyl-tRNA synthetase
MDYKPTLRLPKTDFPMKADLSRREPEIRRAWEGLYARLRKERAGKPRFVFHDGPPYANGDVHIGTSMNKVLKDFIVRSRSMMGFDAPFVPGWDCHGLPIESKVMKEAGAEARTLAPAEIRKRCRKMAEHFVEHQRKQYVRLGIMADWEHPYLTMDPSYEDGVLSAFQDLVEKGYVTRDKRSTAWCPNDATALAEAELEYHDRESPSVYVRCQVETPSTGLARICPKGSSLLVWTTTPWTLPANLAVAVHPELEYVAFSSDMKDLPQRIFIVASRLLESVTKTCGLAGVKEIGRLKGSDLVGTTYRHPLAYPECLGEGFPQTGGPDLRSLPVVPAVYVSAEDGTGCVHTAPGHGADDFATGKANGLPPFSPLDDRGRYTAEVGPKLQGKRAHDEANQAVLGLLESRLVHQGKISHSYAHCWRCKGPILFRATDQWFVRMETHDLRRKALAAIAETKWVPEWGSRRIGGMVESRPDWCISRQRHWGIPIPAVSCNACGKDWTSVELVRNTRAVVAKEGADAWFDGRPAAAFLKDLRCMHCGSAENHLKRDIFDVWFESGTSWRAVVQGRKAEFHFPSDVVIEGTDQHRGWFQLSLLPSVALEGKAPWKTVVTNGFIVDATGDKVSKSKGGMLNADELSDRFGADVARLWVASVNYHDDIPVSEDLLKKVGESYRRIRNTFRWLLGNLDGFDPARDAVADGRLLEADRWVLARLAEVDAATRRAYESYDFAAAVRGIFEFCDRDLSAFWFDFNKDRFYCDAPAGPERRSGQTAAHRVAATLCRLLAPVLVHTCEEAGSFLPGGAGSSVHASAWPALSPAAVDGDLLARWKALQALRDEVLAACEKLRATKEIGGNAEASATVDPARVPAGMSAEALASVFMVSEVRLAAPATGAPPVAAAKSPHAKCARCWNLRPTVGRDGEFPDLCSRCAGVVRALPAGGAS